MFHKSSLADFWESIFVISQCVPSSACGAGPGMFVTLRLIFAFFAKTPLEVLVTVQI